MTGFGIESTADKIGTIAAGVIGAGVAAHAIGANIMKRKELNKNIERGIINEEKIDL